MPQTGPITTTGKEIASQNAVRHGLYKDVTVVAGDEHLGDWEEFHEDAMRALDPEGAVESALASRAAALLWRIRRVPAAEAEIIDRALDRADERRAHNERLDLMPEEDRLAIPFYGRPMRSEVPHDFPDEQSWAPILRVEAHLNRQLMHVVHELEAFQDRRRGNRTPLARVDVHGLPGT